MKDYSYLKGKELVYGIRKVFVAGIEYKKGITVVYLDNPDSELLCLNRKDYCSLIKGKDLRRRYGWRYKKTFIKLAEFLDKNDQFNSIKFEIAMSGKLASVYGQTSSCAFK